MRKARILVFLVALAGMSGAAAAQTEPYESSMREQCMAELDKDARWRAGLSRQFEYEFHERETGQFLTNKQHVIGAYAAILAFMAAFVAVMVVRQRKLSAEIERLRADVERAAKE